MRADTVMSTASAVLIAGCLASFSLPVHAQYAAGGGLATGTYSVAVGGNGPGQAATASGNYATAIGNNAWATGFSAIALGSGSNSRGTSSTAVGNNAYAGGTNSSALGYEASDNGRSNVIAFGHNAGDVYYSQGTQESWAAAFYGALINVARGTAAHDAVDVSQLSPVLGAIGGTLNGAVGCDASTATGDASTCGTVTVAPNNIATIDATGKNTGSTAQATIPAALSALNMNVSNAAAVAVKYDAAGGNTITLGATGGAGAPAGGVKITNLTAGALGNTSTDAVNGSQLNATNQVVSTVATKVDGLGNSTAANLGGGATYDATTGAVSAPTYNVYGGPQTSVGSALAALQNNAPVQYSTTAAPTTGLGANGAPVTNDVTLVGPVAGAPVTLHNVAAGVAQTDAVNVGQLDTTAAAIGTKVGGLGNSTASNLGGGSTYDPTTGVVSAPTYNVYGSAQNNVGSAMAALQNNAPLQYSSAAAPTTGLGANGVPTTNDVTLLGPVAGAPVTLHNVAPGVAQTDAVNVSQLNAAAGAAAGKWITGNPTTYTAPVATGADSTAVGSGAVANGAGDVALGAGTVSNGADPTTNYTTANAIVSGVTLSVNQAPVNGAVAVGQRQITQLADGEVSAKSTDAINGSQLYGVASGLGAQIASLDSSVAKIQSGGTGTGGGGTSGSGSSTTTTTYFHASSSLPDSQATGTNAVAVGPNAVTAGANSVSVGVNSAAPAANAVALGSGSVAGRDNTVSVGTAGNERQITNVAAGTQGTDAVNLNQLNATVNQAVGGLQQSINDTARYAYSGVAAATALTMIPDVDKDKTLSLGVGLGSFRGYQAVAIGGTARVAENIKVRAGVGTSASGTAFGVGAAMQW